ncbi:hypothetical protein [Streptosporangium roseum]|uniref:Uncharacterized protein n=1 Tax=Streptosporangium roseum (strain ATCC 12428 / DSM 43021 / JCM 3005 / KCTC 9067 / NCIMB 10171 / NRRL 2505 / NI 9100) TaxID=479432 RepID=D2B8Q4_STRRD|nr:hypothetical protein [Streptosporangium roseum]ACZ87864.1 hypothetical protein Sros_5075 [Streptosporangium roseum DSM 43021]
MKKMLGAAVLAAAAIVIVAGPASAEARSFTATAQGTSQASAVNSAVYHAYSKAEWAGFLHSQCYVSNSSARAGDIPGSWFGTATVNCQR